jgi:sRNA-binding protein
MSGTETLHAAACPAADPADGVACNKRKVDRRQKVHFIPDAARWLEALCKRYPAVFVPGRKRPIKPLAIGISQQIVADGTVPADIIHAVMRSYVRKQAYLQAVAAGGARYDLAGNPVGQVTKSEQKHATGLIELKRIRWEQKRKEERSSSVKHPVSDSASMDADGARHPQTNSGSHAEPPSQSSAGNKDGAKTKPRMTFEGLRAAARERKAREQAA